MIPKKRLTVVIAYIISGIVTGLFNVMAALVPLKSLPENAFEKKTTVGLEFDVPVIVSPQGKCMVYILKDNSWDYLTKGKLKVDEKDPSGKRVIVSFTDKGIESDVFNWQNGKTYKFKVTVHSIMAKDNNADYIEDYEWEGRNFLPKPEFNLEGLEKDYIVPEDLIFTWRGKENKMALYNETGTITFAACNEDGSPYVGGRRGLLLTPLLIDSINHIYQYRGESEDKENPDTIYLKKDILYYLKPCGLYNSHRSDLSSMYSPPNYFKGGMPEESGKFPEVKPAISTWLEKDNKVIMIYLNYDHPVTTSDFHPYYRSYLNGEPSINFYSYHNLNPGNTIELQPNKSFIFNPDDELEIDIVEGMIGPASGPLYYYSAQRVRIPHPSGIGEIGDEISERELPVYDLYGRRVENPVPGNIYIRGGKKFVMR